MFYVVAMSDFRLTDHGSLVHILPLTDAAKDWVSDHIPADAPWWGNGVVVERRYSDNILNGIDDAGFTIEGDI